MFLPFSTVLESRHHRRCYPVGAADTDRAKEGRLFDDTR